MPDTPQAHIVVANLRDRTQQPLALNEKVVRGDRAHPLLGNPFAMKDKSVAERNRVIVRFAEHLDADTSRKGPLSQLLEELAKEAREGTPLRLMCWCAPLDCHLHVVAQRIRDLANHPNETPRLAQDVAQDMQAGSALGLLGQFKSPSPSEHPELELDACQAAELRQTQKSQGIRQIEALSTLPVEEAVPSLERLAVRMERDKKGFRWGDKNASKDGARSHPFSKRSH